MSVAYLTGQFGSGLAPGTVPAPAPVNGHAVLRYTTILQRGVEMIPVTPVRLPIIDGVLCSVDGVPSTVQPIEVQATDDPLLAQTGVLAQLDLMFEGGSEPVQVFLQLPLDTTVNVATAASAGAPGAVYVAGLTQDQIAELSDAVAAARAAKTAAQSAAADASGIASGVTTQVQGMVPPLVTTALAADGTVAAAAAAAMSDAAVIAKVGPHKGNLAAQTNLDTLSSPAQSGSYALLSSGNYVNVPPGVAGAAATLFVTASSFSGAQEVVTYGSSLRWRRSMTNSATSPRGWSAWELADAYKGTLASATDLDTLRTVRESGRFVLSRLNSYPNMPTPKGAFEGAVLTVESTGVGDTIQTVQFRFDGGRFTREEVRPGIFSAWRSVGDYDSTTMKRQLELIDGRAALAESGTPIQTMLESSGIWTTFGAGEAFLDRVFHRNHTRRTIATDFELRTLGASGLSRRQIRAAIFGDQTKPALLIFAGVHGDEVSSREAALKRVYLITQEPKFTDVCIIIVPTVNPDGTNTSRLNDTGTDLNRQWAPGNDSAENRAVKSLFASFNIRAVLDCHEGGNLTETQLAINETDGRVGLSELMRDTVAAAVNADPEAFPAGEWIDETRIGSAMDTLPGLYDVPYLLIEMPGGMVDILYVPDPDLRVHSYMVVQSAIIALFRDQLAAFNA